MADESKTRMNLAAIKRVDPYAKDIIDSSSHVAFYTFNPDRNEWEKTDVEGALFIYSRNAQPFHSIFVNNRLNTTSFVEPITNQLELQSQPPFLLYRNERSRIRGFWFYDSQECGRIGYHLNSIVRSTLKDPSDVSESKQSSIFNMLSKAQQEYNRLKEKDNEESCSVKKFFAAAKPSEGQLFQNIIPNSFFVDQLENQQRTKISLSDHQVSGTSKESNIISKMIAESKNKKTVGDFESSELSKLLNSATLSVGTTDLSAGGAGVSQKNQVEGKASTFNAGSLFGVPKPSLVPPTMFEEPLLPKQGLLNKAQLVQAFTYLINNDDEFAKKLHDAYLKTLVRSSQ